MRKPLSTVCFELAKHAASANHELLAYILRMAAGEALTTRAEAPSVIEKLAGVWDWDIANDMNHVDPGGAATFSVDPLSGAKGLPLAAFINAIHPEDLPEFHSLLNKTMRHGGHFYHEYRVLHGNRPRWISAQGHLTLDNNGRPIRFPGVLLDISHRTAAEPNEKRGARHLN